MIFRNDTHYARDINNVYARKMKFFEKKRGRCFAGFIKLPTFAIAKRKQALPSEAESPKENGRLAQLVQSVCLTSRGSAVRIRQRPQNLRPHVACGLFLFLKNAFLFETFGCARQSSNKFAFAHLGVTRTLPPLHIATKRTVLRASGRSRCAIR